MADTDSKVNTELVPAVVRQILRLVAPQAPEEIAGAHQLIGDLGFHSLALAELVFTLEDLFGLDAITPDQVMTLNSVGDIHLGDISAGDICVADIVRLIADGLVKGNAHLPSVADVRSLCAQYGTEWRPED